MNREIALAIGVGDARPLPYLSGAVNGARAFHDWARQLGYHSELLTDEEQPVTLARLRLTLEALLPPGQPPVHRMLLYFAGHGLIREAEEGLWLLSDWNAELRAVAVEGLKRRLYMYNIQQIAIFADSCRSLPPDISAADLCPDPVLGRGPARPQRAPFIDKFVAAQDGGATFMVPGATPEQDRCLFSGVLMEGLWGARPEAFSQLLQDRVTSRSLGAYLDAEVPRRAESYSRKLFPSVSPAFPEGDDIYYGGGAPKAPPLPEWPLPAPVTTTVAQAIAPVRFKVVLDDVELKRYVDSLDLRSLSDDASVLNIDFPKSRPMPSPMPAPASSSPRKPRPPRLLDQIRDQSRPEAFGTGAGFAVEGGPVRGVWTQGDVLAESHGTPNWWRLRHAADARLLTSAPVLIEFQDGMFAATTALPGFVASLLRRQHGIPAIIYRPVELPANTAESAEKAIARLDRGALRAGDATDLAVKLRRRNHCDPLLGVLAAYLHDSMGNTDDIRRMAFQYASQQQAIPYDIALLAQLRGEWRNGLLLAHVPAVPAREPRSKAEQKNQWTYQATPEISGEVGGLWPWMRQGWTFLDDPDDDGSTLITPGLIELTSHLSPGRFALLDAQGGRALAGLFGMSSHE